MRAMAAEGVSARSFATSMVRNKSSMTWVSLSMAVFLSCSAVILLTSPLDGQSDPVSNSSRVVADIPSTHAVIFTMVLRPLTAEVDREVRDKRHKTARVYFETTEMENGTTVYRAYGGVGGDTKILPTVPSFTSFRNHAKRSLRPTSNLYELDIKYSPEFCRYVTDDNIVGSAINEMITTATSYIVC